MARIGTYDRDLSLPRPASPRPGLADRSGRSGVATRRPVPSPRWGLLALGGGNWCGRHQDGFRSYQTGRRSVAGDCSVTMRNVVECLPSALTLSR